MTIAIQEKIDSRRVTTGENASAELTYTVTGSADDVAVREHLELNTPAEHGGLSRHTIDIEPVVVDSGSNTGRWTATVRYARRQPIQIGGDGEWTFSTGGGTQHITQSLGTVGSYAASGTAPDMKGAIGYDGERVEGVDITVPVFNFSETHRFAASSVTQAYKEALYNLTGKTNNAAWRGFGAGEVLFLGADGSYRGGDEYADITFRFAASPNRSNINVGGINVTSKNGWDYMWVRYEDKTDGDNLVKQPSAVYVEKVYEGGNFAALGIDT